MSLRRDDRGLGIIGVVFWLLGALMALWIFMLLAANVLEPVFAIVMDSDAVKNMGYDSGANRLWPMLTLYAPLLFGVGAFLLFIIYAVFRERFLGARRPGP